MTRYKTPGIYIEEGPVLLPSVTQVATAIPAFIGYTQKALDSNNVSLLNQPTRITSLKEYETFFGKAANEDNLEVIWVQQQAAGVSTKETISVKFNGPSSKHVMYYALQSYFANGGGHCLIVSVGPFKEISGQRLSLEEMSAGLYALAREEDPTLIVFPEGQNMVESDYYRLQNDALTQCNLSGDRFSILDLHTGNNLLTSGDVSASVASFRKSITHHLKYGAAYFPNIKTIFPYQYHDAAVDIVHMVNKKPGSFNGAALANLKNRENAAYNRSAYTKIKQAIEAFGVVIPPSAAIAGVYVAVDTARGVWKVPANIELKGVLGLTYHVTPTEQSSLNVDAVSGKSINCIRSFNSKGTRVWGARTLAGNDNEWRYIPVRRLFNMVEESCRKASGQFVFEPNDAHTWVKAKAMIENYLTILWKRGALTGTKPADAFYVACGLNQTMTAQDVLNGNLIVEIGMAAIRPAEFIILRFSVKMRQ
ncbi:phage tail sheath C-terminal domain-containing protein [Niabella yanshanensis]|uniref:Phage tail sheath C-terminal domain-containing protein n=1 Tax=Niabella yanshanensis TaxID=577386 RepID=A0ABZ0W1V2_9BACT|nr:phage tail sheath C-terminal domain-containing protein [Niabella yanshanensis]WQD36679.1 phage tail sheath C-terminal domain-containing protein [Niabella yanshanensis]